MDRVLFICKTNLNVDGRIINQLKILEEYKPSIKVDFILLPDRKTEIEVPSNTTLYEVKCLFRHSRFLTFLTVIEWTLKALWLLFKLNPKVIHAQDSSISIPLVIYMAIKGKKVFLIYDDHELPNENESISKKIMDIFENKLIRKANKIIFANYERQEYLQRQMNLNRNKLSYFLNLPYYKDNVDSYNNPYADILSRVDEELNSGIKFIIHQGPLKTERGREKIADFSKKIPDGFKILLLGGTKTDFERFITEYSLDIKKFYFVGSVAYYYLQLFWKKGVASIVMYLPTYINNRLCAPNRLYISIENLLPVLVNKDNPVLANFVCDYKAGMFIEDIDFSQFGELFDINVGNLKTSFEELKEDQKNKFLNIYDVIF